MERKLQGLYAPRKAIYAKDLKVGDITIWNYGYKEEILKITPTKSGKSIKVQILDVHSGHILTRTLRTETLVCIDH